MTTQKREYVKHIIEGELFYPFLTEPSRATEDHESKYSVGVGMTEAERQRLIGLGLNSRSTLKTDKETGKTFVNFNRPLKTAAGDDLSPPVALNSDGSKVTTKAANGSTGKVQLVLVGSGSKSTLRLEAVMFTNLIPYESKGGGRDAAIAKDFGIQLQTNHTDTDVI